MHRSRSMRLLLLILAVALVAASCSSRRSSSTSSGTTAPGGSGGTGTAAPGAIDTSKCPGNDAAGIGGDTITLASSFPQSGLTAAFSEISKGYKAYFSYINAQGAVSDAGKKYKIVVKDKDDEYNAAKTITNIDSLVGADGSKAFAVFNVVGTSNNIAIRQSLNDNCVPNTFTATGSPAMGNPKYQWTIGSTLSPYSLESKAFADFLKRTKPNATVAMLVQDDDYGMDYEQGFRQAIQGTNIKVVKVEKYPVGANEVTAQITSLAATHADAFFDGGTLLACPNALQQQKAANWNAITYVSGTCIAKTLMGIAGNNADKAYSVTNIKDPINPQFASEPAMKLYRAQVTKYQPKADIDNGIVAYGWTQGALFVEALKASKAATRSALMESLRSMKAVKGVGLMIDGFSITTNGDKDPFMGEQMQFVQYDAAKKYFHDVGTMLDFEGQTAKLTPPALING
ncbi:MAG: branched-chain amino acid transporter substrate-binding protein [Acidimicrobiales bacterium]|nr:branched-chain amino acid transporter substrate-binding protein [Acidimicrobiales bacterium]